MESENIKWEEVLKDLNYPATNALVKSVSHIWFTWIRPFEIFMSSANIKSESFSSNIKTMKQFPMLSTEKKRKLSDVENYPESRSSRSSHSSYTVSESTDSGQSKIRRSSRVSTKKTKLSEIKSCQVSLDGIKIECPIKPPSLGRLDPKELIATGNECCAACALFESNQEDLIICDDCENAYHLQCVRPFPINDIPKWQWICRDCIVKTGMNHGFEDNEDPRTLQEFQNHAESFKNEYFGGKNISLKEIEQEFWRLVESPFDDVEVEYGADLHTSIHGSGFRNDPNDPYSKSPWNLNNISVLEKSLLGKIKTDIPGMTVPWIYFGMLFAAFCWHCEDHDTYSINYLHEGSSKIWYGVPASSAEKFERVMKQENQDLFSKNPDLLHQLTTILSPSKLIHSNVKAVWAEQQKGQFIITFPRVYHAGFNAGFNIAEAVNIAPVDWLPFGQKCVESYSRLKKAPVFSHQLLLLNALSQPYSSEAAPL